MRDQTWLWAFLLAVGISAPQLAVAITRSDTSVCDAAAHRAAQNRDVPLAILLSIARVETGRAVDGRFGPWPWSINLAGKGYFFDSAAKAMDFAQQQLAAGVINFDVGCFQINLRWHSQNFASLEAAFDPHQNADYAALFLSQLYQSEGSWAAAVASYHSRTPALGQNYVQNVKSAWQKIAGNIPAPPQAAQPAARPNGYPLLRGGQLTSAGSLVPQSNNAISLIGRN